MYLPIPVSTVREQCLYGSMGMWKEEAMRKTDTGRDQTISIRVSAEEKWRIKEKARKENKTTSGYVVDAAMAGLERKSSRDRKRIARMVKNQEILNDIFRMAKEKELDGEVLEKLEEMMKGENELWQCLQ
ncbi:hypothetical protein [uncultured Bacteroides sp.]|jgi:uncharacterized protein (DUF1778 family)|uniref:plasmid mobilization protein n=1 Tax=uncultured Bacteroides sp. TaxID=162156 RepID=UPI00272B8716|nr:hypothetical protein [uncultured Bacteroides sp.]